MEPYGYSPPCDWRWGHIMLRCQHGVGYAKAIPQGARSLLPGDSEQEVSVRLD